MFDWRSWKWKHVAMACAFVAALLGCMSFSAECVADDQPDVAAAGDLLTGRQASDCKFAVRMAARSQLRKGKITREQFKQIDSVLDSKVQSKELAESVAYSMQDQYGAAGARSRFGAPGFLQWIIDNWPKIMEMIQQIIALFNVSHGPGFNAYVDNSAVHFSHGESAFIRVRRGRCRGGSCGLADLPGAAGSFGVTATALSG